MMARLPRELEDAAAMDGLGAMGTFWHAIFPYAKSILVVIAIFTVMGPGRSSCATARRGSYRSGA
jgi:ABC-type glycerol-3-phosphate transport system permease component